ncbi:hypothetical protein GUJ93_ZPchr0013g34445 [Zizania palustris]|uniref:Uncharacterized protein n=1 Tax=Zizania palustris TaxID=103762 RepID=A0A8J5WZ69_ZIZPA|nr:hypothetical protein GUJ93_ZPchr0013g34445 [Zizania palustris]KAG8098661.1 hypothetical protein GUJ93_ZPchr0013g34445 [Zizania palustris]
MGLKQSTREWRGYLRRLPPLFSPPSPSHRLPPSICRRRDPPASDGESYSHGDSDSSSSEVSAYLGHSHHLAPTICRRRNGETPPLASDGESYSHCDSDSSSSEIIMLISYWEPE